MQRSASSFAKFTTCTGRAQAINIREPDTYKVTLKITSLLEKHYFLTLLSGIFPFQFRTLLGLVELTPHPFRAHTLILELQRYEDTVV